MKAPQRLAKENRYLERGFSLAEVAIAIGLLSFCMISIMGLIPVALKTSRQSMDKNTESRILQSVRSVLLEVPSSTLPTSTNFLFNVDGQQVTAGAALEPYYRVEVSNAVATVLPQQQTAGYLRTANLRIINLVRNETNIRSFHLPDNGF